MWQWDHCEGRFNKGIKEIHYKHWIKWYGAWLLQRIKWWSAIGRWGGNYSGESMLLTQAIWKDCSLKDHRLDRNLVLLSEDSSEINAHLIFTKCSQRAMLFINCPLIVFITVNSKASLQLPWSCLSKFNVNLIILPHYFICNGGNINQACPLTHGKSGQINWNQPYFFNLSSHPCQQQDSTAATNYQSSQIRISQYRIHQNKP